MKTKSKVVIGVMVLALGGATSSLVLSRPKVNDHEAEFQEQLRLARLEGLPTTVAEFEATLPKIKPEENAAPIYRQLMKLKPSWDKDPAMRDLKLDCSPDTKSADREALERLGSALEIIDAATARRYCLYDRDWGLGICILQPELSHMKTGAKALFIRARFSATVGNHGAAVKDAEAMLKIGDHVRYQHDMIAYLVAEAIEVIGMRALAELALQYPAERIYRQALERAFRKWIVFPVKPALRYSLVEVFATIDVCSTKEKREAVGIKETDDLGLGELFSKIQSPTQARANIVKAMRHRWAALDAPAPEQQDLFRSAHHDLFKALITFPIAAKLYESLGGGDISVIDPRTFEVRRLAFKALLRALEHPTIPKTIKTDDLVSPYDQKPVKYSYVNGQILIEVSAPGFNEDVHKLKIGREDGSKTEKDGSNAKVPRS